MYNSFRQQDLEEEQEIISKLSKLTHSYLLQALQSIHPGAWEKKIDCIKPVVDHSHASCNMFV